MSTVFNTTAHTPMRTIASAGHCTGLDLWLAERRLSTDWEAAHDGNQLWIRSKSNADLFSELISIPNVEVFEMDQADRLYRRGASVPFGKLALGLFWQPLDRFVAIGLPSIHRQSESLSLPTVSGAFGAWGGPIRFRLERSEWVDGQSMVPSGLLCRFCDLAAFVLNSAKSEWSPSQFAVRKEGEWNCIVIGESLPRVPGTWLYSPGDRILLPIPYRWIPRVCNQVVRQLFQVPDNDYLFLHEVDGRASQATSTEARSIIPQASFIDVTRSSIRATRESLEVKSER